MGAIAGTGAKLIWDSICRLIGYQTIAHSTEWLSKWPRSDAPVPLGIGAPQHQK
jgi:hypothetical protein